MRTVSSRVADSLGTRLHRLVPARAAAGTGERPHVEPGEFWQALGIPQIGVPVVAVDDQPIEESEHYRTYSLSYPSPLPSAYQENNRVPGRLVLGKSLPADAPVTIHLHDLASRRHFYDVRQAKNLLCAGTHSLLLALPYHFERIPAGTAPGELMFTADVVQSLEAIGQAVSDTVAALRWCTARGHRLAGVAGFSVGGLVGALAVTQTHFDYFVALAPAVNWAGLLWRGRVSRPVAAALQASGIPYEELRDILLPLDPTIFRPLLPTPRILLVEGLHDRIILPGDIEDLWKAWREPPISRLLYGHMTLMVSPEMYRNVRGFVQDAVRRPLAGRAEAPDVACPISEE